MKESVTLKECIKLKKSIRFVQKAIYEITDLPLEEMLKVDIKVTTKRLKQRETDLSRYRQRLEEKFLTLSNTEKWLCASQGVLGKSDTVVWGYFSPFFKYISITNVYYIPNTDLHSVLRAKMENFEYDEKRLPMKSFSHFYNYDERDFYHIENVEDFRNVVTTLLSKFIIDFRAKYIGGLHSE